MQEILLYSVALPFGLTLALLSVAARCRPDNSGVHEGHNQRTSQPVGLLSAAGALAFAAAYLVCHLGIHGTPEGQMEAWEWLLLLVPLSAVMGVAGSFRKLPSLVSYSTVVALAMLAGWFVVPSFQPAPWTWRIAVAATVLCLIALQVYVARRLSDVSILLCWILIGACGLPVLIASANAKFGFYSTSISAAAVGALICQLFLSHRESSLLRSAVLPVSIVFGTLFFSGYFNDYGDVPFVAFGLLMAAPIGLGIGRVIAFRHPNSWLAFSIGLTVSVFLCMGALYFAWPALTAEPAY